LRSIPLRLLRAIITELRAIKIHLRWKPFCNMCDNENLELFRKWYEVLLEVNCLNFTITHSLNFKEAVLFVVLIVLNNMNWK